MDAATNDAPRAPFAFPTLVFDQLPAMPRRYRPTALPFRERWTALLPEVEKDGKARGFYVPARFFVEVRGAKPDKVDHAYIKQKLNDEWTKWAEEVPVAKRGERFELLKLNHTGEEPEFRAYGPGVLVILKAK